MKKEVRKCAVCGKKFTAKTANAQYCGVKCSKAAKAKRDAARKAAKKTVKAMPKVEPKKHVLKEKVVLPKKPVAKKVAKKGVAKKPNVDTIITVKNGNPFKVFVLATMVRERALKEILDSHKVHLGAN